MPGWLLVASCRRSSGRSSASLSPGPRIQLRGREREVASPKPGPRTSQLRGPRARTPAGPAGPAPQAGLAQVRGNAQVRGPAQVRGAHAPEPVTASGLPARARWSRVAGSGPPPRPNPTAMGAAREKLAGSGVRPPEGARQRPCTPTSGPGRDTSVCKVRSGLGVSTERLCLPSLLRRGWERGPAWVRQEWPAPRGEGALNFTHATGNS